MPTDFLAPSPADPTRPRYHAPIPLLPLDRGGVLRHARLAFHVDGEPSRTRDNVVLVLHALTGSADAAGDWWREQIGPGRAIDTTRWAVVSPNLLGSCYGSSGPHVPGCELFPALTVRDQARALRILLDQLNVQRLALVTGGSLGGMVALELAASFPGLVEQAAVFAAPATLGAGAIGWSHVQRRALDLGGEHGLALAREIAMLTYRTSRGLDARFARRSGDTAAYAVQDWLATHGQRLSARLPAVTYRALLEVMDSHDLAHGRVGIGERLRASGTRFTGIGIPGDIFCAPEDVRSWVDAAGGEYRELQSPHGHDAFLLEHEQVSAVLAEVLASTPQSPASRAQEVA
ncbi:MAG: alpha/beta fold hydrolase [Gemmatimonadaceae bacterium]|nr:alpha/beta fold hydrolase [Gemmatimonadaceae bacterium]